MHIFSGLSMNKKNESYGCADYRMEMTLLGIKKQLADTTLSIDDRLKMEKLIQDLERDMGLD